MHNALAGGGGDACKKVQTGCHRTGDREEPNLAAGLCMGHRRDGLVKLLDFWGLGCV